MAERCILGIDPGTRLLGYAVLCGDGARDPRFILAEVEVLTKISNPYARLARIHELVLELIDRHGVTELAVEAPFYGKNAQSMLKLGRAQGVALAAGLSRGLIAEEYSPRRVKEVVTSSGEASKGQVTQMLRLIFPTVDFDAMKSYDATDALAIALCHFYTADMGALPSRSRVRKPKSTATWSQFIESNPNRVLGLDGAKKEDGNKSIKG